VREATINLREASVVLNEAKELLDSYRPARVIPSDVHASALYPNSSAITESEPQHMACFHYGQR
jgi:hypothetical protein